MDFKSHQSHQEFLNSYVANLKETRMSLIGQIQVHVYATVHLQQLLVELQLKLNDYPREIHIGTM